MNADIHNSIHIVMKTDEESYTQSCYRNYIDSIFPAVSV